MRKLIILLLVAFAITACGAAPATPTPTEAPTQAVVAQPTQTAAIVVQTVVVTVVPTNVPTEVPSATPIPPTPTAVPPTAVPATQAVAAPTQAPASTGGLVTLDNALGAGWFNNMTVTANTLSLRCQLYKNLTLSVTPSDKNITQVLFYYRIEDKSSGAVFDWQNFGRMLPAANGNFTLTFTGDNVSADFRKPNAWFDFQFVGLSKSGGVVGRSEKVVQQVNYTFDCP